MILRRFVKLQLVAFAVITLVFGYIIGTRYIGLDDALFGDPVQVAAVFEDSGGIFERAQVNYRGALVGQVESLELRQDGVAVNLSLDEGTEVPVDTRAVIANRTAVGEQYVNLVPNSDGGPFLEDGSEIPKESTETPISTAEVLLNFDRFVATVDTDALRTTVDELDLAFSGTGDDLTRLIESGNELTQAAIDALPETVRLIEDGVTVLRTQVDSSPAILSFSEDLRLFSAQLRENDDDLRRLFDTGAVATAELQTLFADLDGVLPQFLADYTRLAQIFSARVPGVRQVLVSYPAVVGGAFTVNGGGVDDGTAHFGLVEQRDSPVCQQGYNSGLRDPDDTRNTKADTEGSCTDPALNPRGAHYAPRPACQTSGPTDFSTATPRPGSPACAGSGDPGGRDLGGSQGSTGALGQGGAGAPVEMAAYVDSSSGLVTTAAGEQFVVGGVGGQDDRLGAESWTALLTDPLR